MKIKSCVILGVLFIYINDELHLVVSEISFLRSHFIEGAKKYFIDMITVGQSVRLEYDTKEKFYTILNILESYGKKTKTRTKKGR
jgi:hypothetical protein